MNECQMQLWENERDVQALKLVSDDVYFVNESLKLDRNVEGGMAVHTDSTLDDLRPVKNGIDPQ